MASSNYRLPSRLSIDSGPFQSRFGATWLPWCPSIGQYFPDLHLEQLPLGGRSTVFLKRPYFRLGMR